MFILKGVGEGIRIGKGKLGGREDRGVRQEARNREGGTTGG